MSHVAFPSDPGLVAPPPGWSRLGTRTLASADETGVLAEAMADRLAPGDTLLLQGQLGAGKSHFARALIRHLLGPDGPTAEIPSPTFTLVQTYSCPAGEIWHADLYRLVDPDEMAELGLEGAMEDAICLIEWPDRIAPDWPANAVCLRFDTPPGQPGVRHATLLAPPDSDLARRCQAAMAAR